MKYFINLVAWLSSLDNTKLIRTALIAISVLTTIGYIKLDIRQVAKDKEYRAALISLQSRYDSTVNAHSYEYRSLYHETRKELDSLTIIVNKYKKK